jgi:hypothetical protein
MIAQNCLKFDFKVLKWMGCQWNCDKLNLKKFLIFFTLTFPKVGIYFYFFFKVRVPKVPENVDQFVIWLLTIMLQFTMTSFIITLMTLSMFYRRNMRKNFFINVEQWKMLMKGHEKIINHEYERKRKVFKFTSIFILTVGFVFNLLFNFIKPQFEFGIFFINFVLSFDYMVLVMNPKLYSEHVLIIMMNHKISNKLAMEEKLSIEKLKKIHFVLSRCIEDFNNCFGLAIFFETLKNFIFLVTYAYYIAQLIVGEHVRVKIMIIVLGQSVPFVTLFGVLFVACSKMIEEVRKIKFCVHQQMRTKLSFRKKSWKISLIEKVKNPQSC